METIPEKDEEEEEENKQEFEGERLEEWNEEDQMGNLQDLYNEL